MKWPPRPNAASQAIGEQTSSRLESAARRRCRRGARYLPKSGAGYSARSREGRAGFSAEAELHAFLGQAYAGLGEAASAIAEGQKAMAMHPTSKDPFEGPAIEENMAAHLRSAGRCRSRDSHSQAAAADTVWQCDYSGDAATRSGVGSNPQRSSLSGIGRGKEAVNPKRSWPNCDDRGFRVV